MSDSQVVGGSGSQVVGATEPNATGVGAPATDGPLQFSEQDQKAFDTGSGLPSSAISAGGEVISVHSSKGNFYYDRGTLGASGGIDWSKSRGSKYASGYGDAVVAMNDQTVNGDLGFVVSVYQKTEQGDLYWSGGLYNSSGQIDWFRTDGAIGAATSSTPAVALTDDGRVVVTYVQAGVLMSLVGTLQWSEKNITWGPPQRVFPGIEANACGLAVNGSGNVIVCYRCTASPMLHSAGGRLNASGPSITWPRVPGVAQLASAGPINVALDDGGNVIVTSSDPISNVPVYCTGTINSATSGVTWDSPAPLQAWIFSTLTVQDKGVSVAVNPSALILIWQNNGKDYFSGIAQKWTLPSP